MASRHGFRKLATFGVTCSVVAALGLFAVTNLAPAHANRAKPAASVQHRLGAGPRPLAITSSSFSCTSDYFCDYIYDNGTGLCFRLSPFATPGDIPNWGTYGCRNVDGSIYNNSPFTLRIYYGPSYHDPHACIKPFTKISDLFNYDFNSGSGPHNLVIGNDIASSTISLSPCTNPL